jgi:hypothetical protein
VAAEPVMLPLHTPRGRIIRIYHRTIAKSDVVIDKCMATNQKARLMIHRSATAERFDQRLLSIQKNALDGRC